jgi:hypothetical protein
MKKQNMEVLLIEPPATNSMGNLRTLGSIGTFKAEMAWPPLDLMIISGILDKHGISSEIFDANSLRATVLDVIKQIDEKRPRLVVFAEMHDLEKSTARLKICTGFWTQEQEKSSFRLKRMNYKT